MSEKINKYKMAIDDLKQIINDAENNYHRLEGVMSKIDSEEYADYKKTTMINHISGYCDRLVIDLNHKISELKNIKF